MEEPIVKIPNKVAGFLDKAAIKYEAVGHRTVYTAFDKAATLKAKPGAIAKVLVMRADKDLVMAVVSGDRNLDMDRVQKISKAKKIGFAKEKIISETFKGIDPGAIPPFAGLWGIKLFCDKKLLEQPKLILSAGTYESSLIMAAGTFKKANPNMEVGVISVSRPKKPKPALKAKPKTAKKTGKAKPKAQKRKK